MGLPVEILLGYLLPFVLFAFFLTRILFGYRNKAKEMFARGDYEKGFTLGIKAPGMGKIESEPMRRVKQKIDKTDLQDISTLSWKERREIATYLRYLAYKHPDCVDNLVHNGLLRSLMQKAKEEEDVRAMHVIRDASLSPAYRDIFREEIKKVLFKGG